MRKDEVGFLRRKRLRASGVWLLLLAGALGILLLTIGGIGIGGEEDGKVEAPTYEEKNGAERLDAYIGALESKIAEICERVEAISCFNGLFVQLISAGNKYIPVSCQLYC